MASEWPIPDPPECCGTAARSANCFDHREWVCLRCLKHLGLAPWYEPEWEQMTLREDDKGKL